MCRFLMVKSKTPLNPQSLLEDFALMCQESKTLDGDWQGDGWGIALRTPGVVLRLWRTPGVKKKDGWQIYKSLAPIWDCQDKFSQFPETDIFVVHARSASFSEQKGVIEYNQPYISAEYCFVFNGMLKGVKLRKKIKGEIGAQKIWTLLQEQLKTDSPRQALKNVYQFVKNNTREIHGLNIGLATRSNLFAFCGRSFNREYFALRLAKEEDQQIVCSEEIGAYKFGQIETDAIAII